MNIVFVLLILAIVVLELVSMWVVYEKAGIEGWKCLIPIYNVLVLFENANVPMWMFLLMFIPIVQFYPMFLICTALAERVGKKVSDGILLMFFPVIMYPVFALTGVSEVKVVNEEEASGTDIKTLQDGPIEPLGAMPDMGEEVPQVETVEPVLNTASNINTSFMDDTLEPIENVVPINIEDPLAAQDKVQYVEDKKEIYPDVNIFKTCPNCGNKLEPNAKACFLCGKRLDDENS